jgi:hypothetical protein
MHGDAFPPRMKSEEGVIKIKRKEMENNMSITISEQ